MGIKVIFRLESYLDELVLHGRVDAAVHNRLRATLHTQPVSVVIGSAGGIAASWVCALLSGSAALFGLAIAVSAIVAARLSLDLWYRTTPDAIERSWVHRITPLCALAYAGCVAAIACVALLSDLRSDVQVLTIAFAVTYACSATVRCAGRPIVGIGQLLITAIPIIVVCAAIGSPTMLALAAMMIGTAQGMSALTLAMYRTLAEQVQTAQECREMAEINERQMREDAVTGLCNRAGLLHRLDMLIANRMPGEHIALIWLDLHRFKDVNDTLGHAMGDQLLEEMADRLSALAPERGAVARFASDEFIVAAPMPSAVATERLANTISEHLAQPVRLSGNRIESGASLGVALLPDDAETGEKLLQAADLALYHAKSAGRHQVRFFDDGMTRALVRRKEIESELRAAIQRDELSIFFQPIIDLGTGRIRCFEALVRWFHPEKGELMPDEFIPIAEESGLIITLGNWITAQAARAAVAWPDDVSLAINLSPTQIRAPGAALGILGALRDARLAPHRVELEVTEHLFLHDDEQTAMFMEQLSEAGIRFALDDFGTGYSALHYINKYPFKTIKVDRSFISGLDVGRRSDAIIRAVAEMGATLDMEIVAEGLETIDQVQFVKDVGCTLGQGFYFSRAVPDYLAAILLSREDVQHEDTRLAG